MFWKLVLNICFVTFLLFANGCGGRFDGQQGGGKVVKITFESPDNVQRSVAVGDVVALAVCLPESAKLVGVSFDPELLNMIHYLESREDEGIVLRCRFTVIAEGSTDLILKTRASESDPPVIYRRAILTTGQE